MALKYVALTLCAFGLLETLTSCAGWAQPRVDHSPWNALVKRYVTEGRVDYQGLTQARQTLDQYLAHVATISPDHLPTEEARLAFWINAYNACVVKGVVDRYPLKSVKEIRGFFDRIRYKVGGQSLTLNGIEAQGRSLGDWRIHFALVCASSSCPPLRTEAYQPEGLNDQLAEQTRQFLRDSQRGLRLEDSTLWVSQIFKWYAEDFLLSLQHGLFSHHLTPKQLLTVLRPYLHADVAQRIERQAMHVKFLDYDWTLNNQPQVTKPGGS